VKRTSRDDAKRTILRHFRRSERPVYIGRAACLIGWSLRETENLFSQLVVEGRIRRPTEAERNRYDIEHGDEAFIVCDRRGALDPT